MLPFTHSRRSSAIVAFAILALLVLLWKHDEAAVALPSSLSKITPTAWSDDLDDDLPAPAHQPTHHEDLPTHEDVPVADTQPAHEEAPLIGTANATLGFEAILAVSPRSTWRSTGLHAAARRTNLTITIPPQRLPSDADVAAFQSFSPAGADLLNAGSAKAWLGHLQVLNAARNYTSALIVEDDADWDVRVHDQAALVAAAVRNLTVPGDDSPWGDDWDVLWLGHCGESLPYAEGEEPADEEFDAPAPLESLELKTTTTRSRRTSTPPGPDDFITLFDPSLPPTIGSYDARMSGATQSTRWIQHAAGPICTFAYAVTGASVARMLDMQHGNEQAWDLWLHSRCRGRELRCFTVNPEMFHHHVAGGLAASLVNEGAVSEGSRNFTENILYSARCNAERGEGELVSCMHR